MSHFAKVENGTVTMVIVAEQEFINSGAVGDPSLWKQTSYNTRGGVHYDPNTGEPDGKPALRKNYASVGFTYDESRDAFIPPKIFASWILNEETCLYDPPVQYPTDGQYYNWDEDNQTWQLIQREA